MKIRITILTLSLAVNSLLAQENNWQLTLVNGDTISNVSFQNLVGDSLAISQSGQTNWINVESITEIRKIVESEFWTGAGIGAIVGTASSSNEKSTPNSFSIRLDQGIVTAIGAALGSVSGIIIGGTVGTLAGKDEVYDLSEIGLRNKLQIIQTILSKDVPKE
jgi:hypothetical protein